MNEQTVGDLWRIREDLERDAATILGMTLFCFSRLDLSVGLMVASIRRNHAQVPQAPKVDAMSFNDRLGFIEGYINGSYDISAPVREQLIAWLAEAHAARLRRNQLVHGRWSVDPQTSKALNIIGIADSDAQQTIEYSLEQLKAFNQKLEELHAALSRMRHRSELP